MAQLRNLNGETNTYINKNMLVSIVSLATKEIKGVVDVYKSKRLSIKGLFDKNIGKGVKIKYTNIGALIDIYVIISTDCEVNDVLDEHAVLDAADKCAVFCIFSKSNEL